MKLLFKAISFARNHLFLCSFNVLALIGLTLSTQVEMVTLGVISDVGADFFHLFDSQESTHQKDQTVSKSFVLKTWDDIDVDKKGVIDKKDVQRFISKRGEKDPLKRYINKIKKYINLDQNLSLFIIILIIVACLKAFFLFFSRYITQLFSIRISCDLRSHYFSHLQQQPMKFFQKYNIGTLSTRVSGDAHQISSSIASLLENYFHAPFTILSTLAMCFWMSWQLSIFIFLGIPMIIFPVVILTRKVKIVTRQLQKNQESFTSVLIDFLAGIQTVKIFAMEDFSSKKYEQQNIDMARLETKTAKYDLLTRPILHTITTMCLAVVIVVGVHVLHMRLAELIVFAGLLHVFYEPVKKFSEKNSNIQKGVVAVERMNEVLNCRPEIQDMPKAVHMKGFNTAIEFDNVWFKYENEWVLKGVSFSVSKGETVAIIGSTGAGKSTIVQLIPRLYDIQKGAIRIDGRSVAEYTQKSLRDHIAFVSQKPFLFYDTIEANISYGQPFSKDEIISAARKAHAHEFIENLPENYATRLAEMGTNLSGGQHQRLSIARALVKKAPILILDEATSSLDAISEDKIKRAIQELHGEVTQLLIAHRLSTIEYADRVIYLEKGVKIAEGSKQELLSSCEPFRRLWEMNFHQKNSAPTT